MNQAKNLGLKFTNTFALIHILPSLAPALLIIPAPNRRWYDESFLWWRE